MRRDTSDDSMKNNKLLVAIEALESRAEITEIIHAYARGFDRFDKDEVRNCFFAESTLVFGEFHGLAHDFVDAGMESIKNFKSVTHHITNISILVHGDLAIAESYYLAHQRIPIEHEEQSDLFLMGRYVDEFCNRPEGWKIKHRIGLQDCLRKVVPADRTFDSVPASYVSARAPDDPFYLLKMKFGL